MIILNLVLNQIKVDGSKINKIYQKKTLKEFFRFWVNFQAILTFQELPLAYRKALFYNILIFLFPFTNKTDEQTSEVTDNYKKAVINEYNAPLILGCVLLKYSFT